jgi:hypothetical protein
MRKMMSVSLVCSLLLIAATSRSDVAPANPPLEPTPIDEPITGTPITPAPGTESTVPPKDPFAPYDPGPGTWAYEDLSAEERALADRGRDTTGWTEINGAFANASKEQAQRAAAAAAATQMGVSNVGDTGVVP